MTMMEFNKNETLTFCTHLLICSTLHVSTYLIDLDEKALQPFYQKTMTLSLYLNLSQFNQSDQALLKKVLYFVFDWSCGCIYYANIFDYKNDICPSCPMHGKVQCANIFNEKLFWYWAFWQEIHLRYFHRISRNEIIYIIRSFL